MGFLDELKKLTHPYDDEDDDFVDEAEAQSEREERPRSNPFAGFGGGESSTGSAGSSGSFGGFRARETGGVNAGGKVVNLSGNAQTQVILIKPERFESAAEIADHLRAKRPVLVNLENTPKDVMQRLVDFLSGVTYAIDGDIKKVASLTYIIMPPNVNLVGDPLENMSSGVYF